MAMTVVDLMSDGGRKGKSISDGYKPPLTKGEYLALLRGMMREDTYTE